MFDHPPRTPIVGRYLFRLIIYDPETISTPRETTKSIIRPVILLTTGLEVKVTTPTPLPKHLDPVDQTYTYGFTTRVGGWDCPVDPFDDFFTRFQRHLQLHRVRGVGSNSPCTRQKYCVGTGSREPRTKSVCDNR